MSSKDLTGTEALALARKYTKETVAGAGAIKGKSAYQIAVDNGFVGTEQEWLDSLQGEDGQPGPQGEQGPKGDKGDKGDPGSGGVDFEDIGNETVVVTTYDS